MLYGSRSGGVGPGQYVFSSGMKTLGDPSLCSSDPLVAPEVVGFSFLYANNWSFDILFSHFQHKMTFQFQTSYSYIFLFPDRLCHVRQCLN